MENLTNEEKDYYELLVDLLDNGEISNSERNILNKRKEKYSISDSRASEIEEFAKQERLQNLKPQNDSENSYYELILDFVENGIVSESNRKILNKRLEKYGITDARAKELEYFAKQEYLESKKVKFESEEEKEYYEFIVDLMENGAISENSRKILDKRKIKFGISETRAEELEEFAKQNNSASSNDLLEEGKTYYNNGEYDKAIEIFKKAVEINPNDDDSWRWLGNSYYKNGQYQEAIKSFKKAVELNPNDANNYYWLGRSYNDNEQYKEAINSLVKATQLVPDGPEYWYRLCIAYKNNEQYQEAINSGLKATQLNPDYAGNWLELGISYSINKQYTEALNSFLKVVELEPDDSFHLCCLGHSYMDNERYEDAIQSLLKSVELNPNNDDCWYLLGSSYLKNEQYQEAIDSLSKAVELNPNDYDCWYRLGSSYLDLEDYDNAVYSFDKYIKINPNVPYVWNDYGVALQRLNRIDEAISAYSKALEIDPNYELARNNLQILQSSNGGVSLNGVVSGISKGIDTLNELSGKVKPETIGMIAGAVGLIGKILGGSNKNK